MNSYTLTGLICVFLGVISLIVPRFITDSGAENSDREDQVNLALRQVAHNLYTIAGDSTSTIPPVSCLGDNKYAFEIHGDLRYDTLPFLINNAMLDYGIPENYLVGISTCEHDEIVLGYNTAAFRSGEFPCRTREHSATCSIVNIRYDESIPPKASIHWTSICLLGLSSFLILIGRNKPAVTTDDSVKPITKVQNPPALEPQETPNHVLTIGQSTFDRNIYDYTYAGVQKTLTYREAKLFQYLIDNQNEVLKREDIQSNVWQDEGVIVGRSLDVFISRLRKIIKKDETLNIKNIHGVGYRLEVTS